MDLQHFTFRFSSVSSIFPLSSSKIHQHSKTRTSLKLKPFAIRSSLPFPPEKAKYYRELEAAVNVVQNACRVCVDVQKTMLSHDRKILEKNDNSPVTIADFSVQALISLELSRLFPSIPLVAEEDSAFLRANNLVDPVVKMVNDKTNFKDKQLMDFDVLEAIDRGGENAVAFDSKPASYWLLDPIDGTKGFLNGGGALYVVGLALIIEGEIVLGVMGCPKWPENFDPQICTDVQGCQRADSESGVIMVAHVSCGTWKKRLPALLNGHMTMNSFWERCFVSECSLVREAHFCISDTEKWDALPLSDSFIATTSSTNVGDKQILLIPACCGSLSKYVMVASGRASVFLLRSNRYSITIKAWDHIIGMICVHEAGGKVTDWSGSNIDFAADEEARRAIFPSGGILVTNGALHGQILELFPLTSSVVS